jgi:hypothetical protein
MQLALAWRLALGFSGSERGTTRIAVRNQASGSLVALLPGSRMATRSEPLSTTVDIGRRASKLRRGTGARHLSAAEPRTPSAVPRPLEPSATALRGRRLSDGFVQVRDGLGFCFPEFLHRFCKFMTPAASPQCRYTNPSSSQGAELSQPLFGPVRPSKIWGFTRCGESSAGSIVVA